MKVGFDIQFAMTRARTGLHNMAAGLLGELRLLTGPAPVLLACQRQLQPYDRFDVEWASGAFGGLPMVLERPPRLFYRAWHSLARHNRMDVLVHNLHGVFPAASRGANVFIVPDVIPLTVNTGHPGYPDECMGFYRRAIETGDAVVVLSMHTKQELIDATGGDPDLVHVVPLGVGREYRPLTAGERASALPPGLADTPYILCVSTLEPRKNHSVLLRAFARLVRERPDLPHQLVLVGASHDNFCEPLELVQSLGLQQRVRHLGFTESLPALYGGAQAFVFPSSYEGFGLPPLEAMACGTPVICSSATSLPEVVGDAGLLFEPQDVRVLVQHLLTVLTQPPIRQELAEKSLERARQFSWERAGRRFYDVLAAAVSGRRGSRRSDAAGQARTRAPRQGSERVSC